MKGERRHPDYVYKVLDTGRGKKRSLARPPMRDAMLGVYKGGELFDVLMLPYYLIKGSRRWDEVIFKSIITERP